MIEAIEVHETQITKPIPVRLKKPLITGVYLGIGFLLAPTILCVFIYLITLLLATCFE